MFTRLGKNTSGYFGEVIDIKLLLAQCAGLAKNRDWEVEEIPAPPKPSLLALKRILPASTRNIYISAGIHGDEPAGPVAVRSLMQNDVWPPDTSIFLLPCLNPTGFLLNRRENDEGTDLNRQYLQPKAEETLAHIAWLDGQPRFDLCLCLHEDWESHGFYIYELNPDQQPSLAEKMIEAASRVCPIDHSEIIEGRPAEKGIIRPNLDPRTRPQWPESFYLITHKARLSYTLEAPSDFTLECRAAALDEAVKTALAHHY